MKPDVTQLALSWFCLWLSASSAGFGASEHPWVVYPGGSGPGAGKHIVLVSGDEEYRSEEALPTLARILSVHHGFRCTVLFAIDPESGEINPDLQTHIPGLHLLESADLLILFIRFRELPDEQMKWILDYVESGRPVIGLRTSTHPFRYTRRPDSPYARYSFDSRQQSYEGGFGRRVFGETWVNHHGIHGKESTRGLIDGLQKNHPILRGVRDIWGPTDVYGIRELQGGQVLVHGLTLAGMEPDSPPNFVKALMPIAWTRTYKGAQGKPSRVFFTTMGSSQDFESRDLRRMLVNASYWAVGLDSEIPEKSRVDTVGEPHVTPFGFGGFQKGLKPADFALEP